MYSWKTLKIQVMIIKKTSGADLENKRGIFLELGLIITLVVVFLAFNWKTYEKPVVITLEREMIDVPEEMIPITEQKPPEPPKMQAPRTVVSINIVEDDIVVDEEIVIDAEADQKTEVPEYVPVEMPVVEEEENVSEKEIFLVVESMPEFPGGEAALYQYLADNLDYPEMARETGISGKVFVTFVVEKDGSITDVRVLRGIGGGCDEEAIRGVKSMPKWTPGRQRNMPVRVQFNLPIKFTLQQI